MKTKTVNILLFVFAFAIFAWLIFILATLGFNPTDEGVVLSLARRLLMGEIPHKDFISIRPVGSGMLHIPELFFGSDYVFFISRLVACFELGATVLLSILLIEKASPFRTSLLNKIIIFFIGFFLTINSFPLMAWTTIDALFCTMLGTWLSTLQNQYLKQFGYGIAAYAMVCKQNFILVPFALIFLNRDYKNVGVWLFTLLPLLVYSELVYFSKSWNDALMQLSSRTEILETGVKAYYKQPFLWIGLGVGQLFFLLFKNEKMTWAKTIFIFLLPFALLAALSYRNSYKAVFYFEFGVMIALLLIKIYQRKSRAEYIFFTLLIAWCCSISLGYNSPALAAGVLWIGMLGDVELDKKWLNAFVAISFVGVIASIFYLRTHFIYRENSAFKLKSKITIDGFANIKTNNTTASAMNELNLICKKINKPNYCVITDYAAFWATHPYSNPLPLDWTINDEMPSKLLLKNCWNKIWLDKQIKFVVVQKYETWLMQDSLVKISSRYTTRTLLDSVQLHCIKKWEGNYFSVFTKPML